MKLLLSFLIFVLSLNVFSSTSDSTLKADLNFDGQKETIKLIHTGEAEQFTLRINDAEIKGKFDYAYGSGLQMIDMNKNDNLRELIVVGYGNSDQNDIFFYQFVDGKIIEVAHLPSNFGVETSGDNTLIENGWMGFWSIKLKYDFDSKKKTLTLVNEEFYDVNQECEVKNPFKLLSKREDDAPVAVQLMPGTKLAVVKADITPKCKTTDGYDDDFFCDWYLIRTADGKEGWVRLKDFQENVDGLVWAG